MFPAKDRFKIYDLFSKKRYVRFKKKGFIFSKILAVLFVFSLFIAHYSFFINPVFAQSDISGVYDITDKNAKDGDIMTFTTQGITRASVSYDTRLFGVLQTNPTIVYRRVDGTGQSISRVGVVNVNVTTLNGDIKSGDYITSSELAGSGMKADISGWTIGIALKDFTSKDGQGLQYQGKSIKQGQIPLAVNIQFSELTTPRSFSRLFSGLGAAFLQNSQSPDAFAKTSKYIIVGLVMLLTIIFDFIILSRSMPKAIEALGRNPLGRSAIILSLSLNIGFVAFSLIVALAISFIILRL